MKPDASRRLGPFICFPVREHADGDLTAAETRRAEGERDGLTPVPHNRAKAPTGCCGGLIMRREGKMLRMRNRGMIEQREAGWMRARAEELRGCL